MCCIQISNDILLENVLSSIKCKGENIEKIRFEDIENCGVFLENNLPGYVDCEVDMKSIHEIAKSYGCVVEDEAIVNFSDAEVTRKKTFRTYPSELANQIESLVEAFWQQNVAGQNITRMKHIVAE